MTNQVWHVQGVNTPQGQPVLVETKYAAEILARIRFPNEPPTRRYARIQHQTLLTEQDLRPN